jgi:3-hydroxypropanoate dehydrogenase
MSNNPTNRHASDADLDLLFREARTHTAWQNIDVALSTIIEAYNIARMGPTSANSCPMRILFLKSEEAKARLYPALAPTNVEKSRTAPVVAIIAYDTEFHEKLPKLYPAVDARAWFVGNQPLIDETAFRNSSLQGAYFIIAARAVGLDCGPMSGFDQSKVNAEFFPDGKWKANFVCNLGYGDPAKVYPRAPRLEFEEACQVL